MDNKDSSTPQMMIGVFAIFVIVALFLWSSGPRLIRDFRHAGDFVPAQGHRVTEAKCTNWNGGIVSECTVKFVAPGSSAPQEFTDWRFGSAPQGRFQIMQRRSDATAVTSDVSLQTLTNRMILGLTLVLGGLASGIALMRKVIRPAAPAGGTGWAEEALRRRGMS